MIMATAVNMSVLLRISAAAVGVGVGVTVVAMGETAKRAPSCRPWQCPCCAQGATERPPGCTAKRCQMPCCRQGPTGHGNAAPDQGCNQDCDRCTGQRNGRVFCWRRHAVDLPPLPSRVDSSNACLLAGLQRLFVP